MRTFDELRKEISQYYPKWEKRIEEINDFLYVKLSREDFTFVSNKLFSVKKDFSDQKSLMNELHNKSILDVTTGLYSKTFYGEKLKQLSNHPDLAFLIADVDYFKKYNDIYGHVQGDKALWCISQQFKKSLENLVLGSENLSVMRFGGEEICAFIENWQRPDSELYQIADSVRQDIEFMEIERAKGESSLDKRYKHTTITIARGIKNYYECMDDFVKRVDKELTRKNSDGRNRVYP